jgi:hypothetical protein
MTEAHFQREEQEVFPLARSLMPMNELSQPIVGNRIEAAHFLRRGKDTQGPTAYSTEEMCLHFDFPGRN